MSNTTRAVWVLLGVMLVAGFARVTEQTAIWRRAYALGRHTSALESLRTETEWLATQVTGLRSPGRLVGTLAESSGKLVARWSLPPEGPRIAIPRPSARPPRDRGNTE